MFYDSFLKYSHVSGEQRYAHCPAHEDNTPSLTVNEKTGEWYCHSCSKGGKEGEFVALYYDVPIKTAHHAYDIYKKKSTFPFPTEAYVEGCHKVLLSRPTEIAMLNDFGISNEIINEFQLGLDDLRIVFPVRSRTGKVINVRKYLPPSRREPQDTKIIQARGVGDTRFYPYIAFDDPRPIYIVEGEKDCLVARSYGLNAVTSTGGSSIPTNEIGLFKGKEVIMMGDSDEAGALLAKKYLRLLAPLVKSLSLIKLPEKDFTDYVVKHQVTDLSLYLTEVKDFAVEEPIGTLESVTLAKSEFAENHGEWLKLEGMSVVGVEPKIYTIPRRLVARCTNSKCDRPCPLQMNGEDFIIEVEPRQLLQFLDSPDTVQDSTIRKLFGCKAVTAEGLDYINAQKIIFQESASFIDGLEESTFENRYGIYLYDEYRLNATLKYDFEACRVTDPRNQQNYYVIRYARSQATVEDIVDYEVFQPFRSRAEEFDNFQELANHYYQEWLPTLGIEGRVDLFSAMLLTYCSVTEIPWQAGIVKGWLDTMIIGDTRTGKSQMAQRFVKNLHMGGYINGENARRTGVIGGVQRFGDSWVITWGAIPMNDLGLLIIDEASGLSIDDIKDLSSTRSSGAVTINKVVKGEARARTRLIWCSNPRSGKNLDEYYWKGFGAFQEFIPVAEDQARFDVVLTAARDDVEFLDGIDSTSAPDFEVWRQLFKASWSLKKEDIVISPELIKDIRDCSKNLGLDYSGGPLVVPVAVHEKVLRLSCAIAVLCGGLRNGKLFIESRHVEFANQFLRETLEKPTFSYGAYTREYQRAKRKSKENIEYIRALLTLHPALRVLLSASNFRGYQFQEILGIDRSDSSKIMSDLITRGLLRPMTGALYVPDKLLMEVAKQGEVL